MPTPTVVTDEQIHQFLKYLIELVPALYVDEDGYPRKKSTNEMIYAGIADSNGEESKVKKPLILYGAPKIDSECTVLNPFIEGMTQSAASNWFESVLLMSASNYLRWIQKSLLYHALEAKSKTKSKNIDLELASIISPWVDKVDETMIKELDQLNTKMSDYFRIYYLTRKRTARISCGLIDSEEFKIAHKKVRAKTWDVLTAMVKQIFDTEDFGEYSVTSKIQGCPKFDAELRVMYKVLTMLNRYLKYISKDTELDRDDFDLDYLSTSIDLLDLFRAKAKYLVPTVTNVTVPSAPIQNNPINNVQPTVGLPGVMNTLNNNPIGIPGQPNMPLFNPQMNMGVQMPAPNMSVGLPSFAAPMQPMNNTMFQTPFSTGMNTKLNNATSTNIFGKQL